MQGKAKNTLESPKAARTHDHTSIDTIKISKSFLEDNVDTIKFSHAEVPGIKHIPPGTELQWKLSLEEIDHQRTLQRLDEIKRYILLFSKMNFLHHVHPAPPRPPLPFFFFFFKSYHFTHNESYVYPLTRFLCLLN
jgi:hypothetical protein